MAMTLVTGPPGSGKTWYSIRLLAKALHDGKYVGTNVQLNDGWAYQIARVNWLTWLKGGKKAVEAKARQYEERVFISGQLEELFALRLPLCGACKGCKAGRNCQREGRGEMILDEAHEWLNARMWDIDHTGAKRTREESVASRLVTVKFFALHRKLGWNVKLITQSEKRLDNQVRDNFEFHTRLKNMKKWRALGFIKLFFFNWFVAITFWHASGGERVGIESYLLTKLADIYDTMARPELVFGEREGAIIELPLSQAEREQRQAGEWQPPWAREQDGSDGRDGGASAPPAGRPGRTAAEQPAPPETAALAPASSSVQYPAGPAAGVGPAGGEAGKSHG